LRGLRGKQEREGLVGGVAARLGGETPRRLEVAGADRDQAARDRLVAARRATMAQKERDVARRTPDREAQPDEQRRGERDHHDRDECDAEAGAEVPAQPWPGLVEPRPGDHDLARAVGEPDDAESHHRDRDEKDDDTDHLSAAPCAGRRTTSSDWVASAAAAAIAASRASARLIHGSSGARTLAGSFAASASEPTMS